MKKAALISAYIMGAQAKTHEEMVSAVKLSKILELTMTEQEIAQAKLEAELKLDPIRMHHVELG